jgi:probable lipoprotein NlpC
MKEKPAFKLNMMKRFMILLSFFFLVVRAGSLFAVVPLQGVISQRPDSEGQSPESLAHDARLKLIAAAEKYQGTPYRYGGIDPRGLDCSGLVYLSFKDALGVSPPRSTGALYSWVEKIGSEQLQPGDLVFFATLGRNNRNVSHVGIYTGNGRFIHSASDGPQTGVMYSDMDESYWRQNFVSAGRALPEGSGFAPENAVLANAPTESSGGGSSAAGTNAAVGVSSADTGRERVRPSTGGGGDGSRVNPNAPKLPAGKDGRDSGGNGLLAGIGIAPAWNGFLEGGTPLRGGGMQVRVAYKTSIFGKPILPGLELRPEWDNALGVFRLPVTLSLGLDDRFRIFGGPSLSMGDPVLQKGDTKRHYTGGNGTVGITVAPFLFKTGRGTLAPYGELAWQSYFSDGEGRDWNADFSAGLRLSTGIRFTIEL